VYVTNDLFYLLVLSKTKLILVAILRRMDVLFGTFLGGKIFGEKNVAFKFLISLLMIFGAIILILP